MEFKDIKVGDKVRLNRNLTRREIGVQVCRHSLPDNTREFLQEEKTVSAKDSGGWSSIQLEEDRRQFYWPIELFEPVNTIKSTEGEQVQEDIQKIKDIIKRYNLKNKAMGGLADTLIGWLEEYGQDNLSDEIYGRIQG